MPDLRIRAAQRADVPLILRFVRELAIYEKALDEVVASEATVEQSLFDEGARAFAFICEDAGEPIGFAVCFYSYSTWLARNGLYLEDLYVTPEARGRGAGKALLQYLARLAVEEGCGRFEWSVLDWNTPAIDFYESVGARPQSEWTTYRLAGDALSRFAKG
ncbi:GNAT family N-acetyltransferase [Salinisphaera sp.]|uniref:GNAT family N-acetyltransferase n=1 Tax=Salinisphaera sp. TaxID=1914330 RepID=UPI000C58708E|nr:GNAT family N-acetyltransferase [Salinisphaera sp.]MBS63786.1 GNAT family N-acetyltransferase [Salinisphaera sp.]